MAYNLQISLFEQFERLCSECEFHGCLTFKRLVTTIRIAETRNEVCPVNGRTDLAIIAGSTLTIKAEFGTEEIEILHTRGLCSYYAEPGSVMVGFDV